MCLDGERHRLALGRKLLQRARGAMHEIADAVHVDDHEVLAVAVDDAFQLADHGAFSSSRVGAKMNEPGPFSPRKRFSGLPGPPAVW